MKKIITRTVPQDIPQLHANPLMQKIFAARGVQAPEELEYNLNRLLPYETLSGIKPAVACLEKALIEQQRILIVGDFDADGATSTALAVLALKSFGFQNVNYLVPNRFTYGYGLTPEIIVAAKDFNPQLIITVDNGVSSMDGVRAAKELGIDVLVTDHHLSGNDFPDAVAIVDPNLNDDKFPSKNLAGVGVIFYVMLALRSHLRQINWPNIPNMAQFLDLVALGTVADVVQLDSNNRILVQHGLERIRAGKCCAGIKALLAVAKHSFDKAETSDLGFIIAPRINAAGRLDDMSLGIECLLTDDVGVARKIASELNTLNSERREIEADMHKQAARVLENLRLDRELPIGLCVFEESWHQGVLGILASRLKDKLHRPVIAFAAISETEVRGSARSVAGIHIRDILSVIAVRHPGLITKFGGHAMAAGLSLPRDALETFTQVFADEVGKHLDASDLCGVIFTDGELPLDCFTVAAAELLQKSGPWGHGFAEPLFEGVFELVDQRLVGQKHLKMTLRVPGTNQEFDAISFNVDTSVWPNYRSKYIRAVYRLDINEYNGRRNLQLIIEYFEAKGEL